MSELILEHKTPQRPGKTQDPAEFPFYITGKQWDMKRGSNPVGLGVPRTSQIHRSARRPNVSICNYVHF